jgi:hypothetical protein
LSDEETAGIARLRDGMRESLDRARLDVSKLIGSGDALGADEHIRLLEISFKGTEHEKLVDAKEGPRKNKLNKPQKGKLWPSTMMRFVADMLLPGWMRPSFERSFPETD